MKLNKYLLACAVSLSAILQTNVARADVTGANDADAFAEFYFRADACSANGNRYYHYQGTFDMVPINVDQTEFAEIKTYIMPNGRYVGQVNILVRAYDPPQDNAFYVIRQYTINESWTVENGVMLLNKLGEVRRAVMNGKNGLALYVTGLREVPQLNGIHYFLMKLHGSGIPASLEMNCN